MYIKLNFSNNVMWRDAFNMLRIIFANNITSVSSLTSNSDYTSSIDATTRGYLNTASSEIFRTTSPGIGYGTSGNWTYNWSGGSPTSFQGTSNGPEITIERKISTYGSSDATGKYYIKLWFDNSNLNLGCYRTATNYPSSGQVSGNGNLSPALSNGDAGTIAYSTASITSIFLYINQYSFLIGGKGSTGSLSTSGWINSVSQTIQNQVISAATTQTTSNGHYYLSDGAKIRFAAPTSGTSSATFSANYDQIYYARATGGGSPSQNWSFSTSLWGIHTNNFGGSNGYVTTIAGTNNVIIDTLPPQNPNIVTSSTVTTSGTTNLSSSTVDITGSVGNARVGSGISGTGIALGTIITQINVNVITISIPTTAQISASTGLNINRSNDFNSHWGPAFVSEYTPYDPAAIVTNEYVPVLFYKGLIAHTPTNATNNAVNTLSKSWYGMSAQDFLWGDSTFAAPYRVLRIQQPTPNTTGSWSVVTSANVYIGTDARTTERAPLGDSNNLSTVNDRAYTAVLSDVTGTKFPDATLSPGYGLFPLVWSGSMYNTAGGKLVPNGGSGASSGFMLFNGDYQPDDYFTNSGIDYALWPLADGHLRRLGLAVPKG